MSKAAPRKKTPRDDPKQSRLFIEKAREIGADAEQSCADELLGHLHKKPPTPHAKGAKEKRGSSR